MESTFVGIVGSRRRATLADRKMVFRLVERLRDHYASRSRLVLVSGGCPTGADHFMEEAAQVYGVETEIHPVDKKGITTKWEFRERAFSRNRVVAERSSIVFCLVSPDRTGGTENTIDHAVELKKKIFLVTETGDIYLSREDGKTLTCAPQANLLDLSSIG